ncbi:multicopper oxidase family protein [Candidatus Woesearchaeota archaeon]|nr:MAG: multicopper oxidase family protein [Candidatus Woesearchaeota archaeon]
MRWFIVAVLLAGCVLPVSELQKAGEMQGVILDDGARFSLVAAPVKNELAGVSLEMFAYNGQVPGPILRVRQNSTITVNFTNNLPMESTVHWHGLRLENKYDGVPDVTQGAVQPGKSFEYKLTFPDYGLYWYHPHTREDLQQEKGLAGVILVEPIEKAFVPAKEEVLVLDDVLITEGGLEFGERVDHALMGRFGNVMLVNGKANYSLNVKTGERVRFFIVDVANTRLFNFSIEGARLKVVGADSELYQDEFFAPAVVLAPGERVIVEAVFERPGVYRLMHKHPHAAYVLGEVIVSGEEVKVTDSARKNKWAYDVSEYVNRAPDFAFELDVDMQMMGGMNHAMMGHGAGRVEPIEWEDTMQMMNAHSTDKNTRWIIREVASGRENMDISLTAKVGDVKMLRFTNLKDSAHPMQHPIHLHGQRFLVLGEKNSVWKDTVIVPAGESVDVLVEFTNPGKWMMHCHIAEHLHAGMMAMFDVSA